MSFEQRNATLDKVTTRLDLAGISTLAPILSGLRADVTLLLHSGESLKQIKVTDDDSYENILSATVSGNTATVSNFVFGVHSTTGKNYIEWRTSKGTARQQFYVAAAPTTNGIFVNNQNAQGATAYVYRDNATVDRNKDVSLAINILPYWSDEFFKQQWYTSNAYANTLRNFGGAKTAEILIDDTTVVSETIIGRVYGYYWEEPAYGYHSIKVRLRAATGSSYYVTLSGNIRVRQMPCS